LRRLDYLNIADEQRDNVHGYHDKIGVVLHETVSPQYPGWKDIKQTSEYLDAKDYGIHGITDNDGNIAWAYNLGRAIFWHTASNNHPANTNYMGIEQISRVMLDYKSMAARAKAWLHMDKEINATAKLIACVARAHDWGIKGIVDNPGDVSKPGVTTHYEVTKFYGVSGGHVDCWPVHKGGYYPKGMVITLARRYYRLGWRF